MSCLALRIDFYRALSILIAMATSGCGADTGDDAGDLTPDAASGGDAQECAAPDMLIVLDRTLTMARRPDGTFPLPNGSDQFTSKWWQADVALDGLLGKPGLDKTIRFGLSLFPREATGCVTLGQKLAGNNGSNATCEPPEVLVPPALGSGSSIIAAVDPTVTKICYSTPAGLAIEGARDALAGVHVAGRKQYVVFVTDGADFEDTCPAPSPLPAIAQLAAGGVKTYVVGFAAPSAVGGVKPEVLNAMACAGQTAEGFATNCKMQGGVYVPVDASPNGPRLYLDAADANELEARLTTVAGDVCCGCIL